MNCAFISRAGLYSNIAAIKEKIGDGCRLAAVIKGDAYGHGMMEVAVALEKCPDVHMLVVSSFEEALQVSGSVVRKEILILNRIFPDSIKTALSRLDTQERRRLISQCVFSAYRISDLKWLDDLSISYGECFKVHIRLDFSSGMRGFDRPHYEEMMGVLKLFEHLSVCGMYAHVYSAYTDIKEARADINEYSGVFLSLPASLREKLLLHMLSSASYFRFPEARFDMVRIGADIYGMPNGADPSEAFAPALVSPIMSIRATVVSCSDTGRGSRADYEGYLPDDVRRVALISIGNWDIPGFFLKYAKDSKRHVRIGRYLCRIVGAPCMDTLCADITDIEDISPGDTVWIMDEEDGIRLKDWLGHSGLTFGDCQMLFSGMARVPKVLREEPSYPKGQNC